MWNAVLLLDEARAVLRFINFKYQLKLFHLYALFFVGVTKQSVYEYTFYMCLNLFFQEAYESLCYIQIILSYMA